MRTKLSNQWQVATDVICELTNTTFFNQDDNADRICWYLDQLVRWSEANYQVYGDYDLDAEQKYEVLCGELEPGYVPSEKTLVVLIATNLVLFGVNSTGVLGYLPVSSK